MRVTITIDCDNEAFGDEPAVEVARILQRYTARLREAYRLEDCRLRDVNGNTVGQVEISE